MSFPHALLWLLFSFTTLQAILGGSLDDVTMDVELSESSVVDGDVVFAKITLTNSGSSEVAFQTIDPLRHLDVMSHEFIASPYAIVGHRAGSDDDLQGNVVTRLNPKERVCYLVMVRILGQEFSHWEKEPQAARLEFTVRLFRTPDELSSDKDPHLGILRAKIVGEIVSVPMVARLLPIPNRRFLRGNFQRVMGEIHGGLTVKDVYSTPMFTSHPGILKRPSFPLDDLTQWQKLQEDFFVPDSVLYRLVSNSLAYDAIRQDTELSDARCFQKIRSLIQKSPPMERWWMLDQIHQDPKLENRKDLVAKIKSVLDAFTLKRIEGHEPQPIEKIPTSDLRIDIELSEHQIIDGDVMFIELSLTNQSDKEIFIHHFWLEKSLEVRFPSGTERRSMVMTNVPSDGLSLISTYMTISLKPKESFQKTALIRLPSLFPQRAARFEDPPHLPEVEITLKLNSSAAMFPKRDISQTLGEITGKRLSLPLYGNILRDGNPNSQALQQIHGIQRFIYVGGHGYGIDYELRRTVPLFSAAEFPLEPLVVRKFLRDHSIRDDTSLARLIDTSIKNERIADENENWRTQHAQILDLIKNSPRIEKKWLYYFLSHDLLARMDLNMDEQIEFYQLQREADASFARTQSTLESAQSKGANP
tara:strand:+ start:2038 stop:3969 length:1932 start_codon:yes stop_codon:yes gene_type:complete